MRLLLNAGFGDPLGVGLRGPQRGRLSRIEQMRRLGSTSLASGFPIQGRMGAVTRWRALFWRTEHN